MHITKTAYHESMINNDILDDRMVPTKHGAVLPLLALPRTRRGG